MKNSPVSPSEQAISPTSATTSLAKKGPIVHEAKGAGNFIYEGKNTVFRMTVHEYADGTIDGNYENNASNATGIKWLTFNGNVVKFRVEGNIAIMLGQDKTGDYIGGYDIFFTIDNGQGGKTVTPDQVCYNIKFFDDYDMAVAYFNQPAATIIEDLKAIKIDSGNIQVY